MLHGAGGVHRGGADRRTLRCSLAGSKGIPDQAIVEVIRRGINKINIDTDMRLAFVASIRDPGNQAGSAGSQGPDEAAIAPAIKKVATGKMQLFGSAGMAADMIGNDGGASRRKIELWVKMKSKIS